ncbi:type II toxin-antitoxin system RelB family antitoxin [Niveispirillum irakense]|uniref:type II toxin-antitoxin system RelB family antitoxin n=1 Tax=Niveispirillum irakense TaxID=34011 RepID=UPI0003F60554|nr:DUF6290 family protein [Niveispirillum irakense]
MPVSIRLEEDIERRLDGLAKATGRTKAFYIRQAITEYLQDMEDAYLAKAELEAVQAGRSETTSLDDLLHRYDLPVSG